MKHLSFDILHCTEQAALASTCWIGRGDEKAADRAAVDAMRESLNNMLVQGRVVTGEGERDNAPMLYIGETVGTGQGMEIDIAVDPLEGTTFCANNYSNALTVLAFAQKGGFLHAPDIYMEKIAVGSHIPSSAITLDSTIEENIKAVANAKKCNVHDVHLVILNRTRHDNMIHSARKTGAKITLIDDGDIAAIIQAALPSSSVDMVIGIGGAPEGVLAAAALRCLGGSMFARLVFDTDKQKDRAHHMGITNMNTIYNETDMAKGNILFCTTGVTQGALLNGVTYCEHHIQTESLLLSSETKTIRYITSQHKKILCDTYHNRIS